MLEPELLGGGFDVAAGLAHGMVAYEDSNPASGSLYRGAGFIPTWTLWDYEKPIAAGRQAAR